MQTYPEGTQTKHSAEADATVPLSTIKNKLLYCDAQASAKIDDLWFNLEDGRVSHVVLDLGNWVSTDLVLGTPDRIAMGGDEWSLVMSEEELTRAPRWADPKDAPMANWPPIIIGPFGSTLSFPLLAAQLRGDRTEPDVIAEALAQTTDSASDLMAAPVFAADGELGRVEDVAINVHRWTITHIVVGSDDGTTRIALADIRRQVDQDRGGHVIVTGHCDTYRIES